MMKHKLLILSISLFFITMENKAQNKLLVLSGVIMLLCSTTFAQMSNWTLGFRAGYKIGTLEKTNSSSLGIITTYGNIASPTIELNLTYDINKNVSLTSGIAYLEYYAGWATAKKDKWYYQGGSILLKYAQIPFILKSAIPLGKSNFSVYGKLGFSFDILVYASPWHLEETDVSHYENDFFSYSHEVQFYDKKINILLNTGIGVKYRFKNGLGLSIEGDYNTGLRTMGEVLVLCNKITLDPDFEPIDIKKYRDYLLIKGNYWNFSMGVSYTFKKKEKKEAKTLSLLGQGYM